MKIFEEEIRIAIIKEISYSMEDILGPNLGIVEEQ